MQPIRELSFAIVYLAIPVSKTNMSKYLAAWLLMRSFANTDLVPYSNRSIPLSDYFKLLLVKIRQQDYSSCVFLLITLQVFVQ